MITRIGYKRDELIASRPTRWRGEDVYLSRAREGYASLRYGRGAPGVTVRSTEYTVGSAGRIPGAVGGWRLAVGRSRGGAEV